MKISSSEEAYQAIAQDLLNFPNGRTWTSITGEFEILSTMVSSKSWLSNNGIVDKKWNNGSTKYSDLALEAVRYLRDNIQETSGQRIWGLKFTLHPTGKFEIDYDYTKPDGYEETDETVNAREVFSDILLKGKPSARES